MQPLPSSLRQVLSERLKLGQRAKPVCRVEVDRMAFVPGVVEELQYLTFEAEEQIKIIPTWVEGEEPGDMETTLNKVNVAFPIQGVTLGNAIFTDYFNTRGGKHKGVDLAYPIGTPVVAVWSGQVALVDRRTPTKSYGFNVRIRHGKGIMTLYAHLSEILVEQGDYVEQGQVIGYVGNTGNVWTAGHPVTPEERKAGKGAHLHFEVIEDAPDNAVYGTEGKAKKVDPLPYLRGDKVIFNGITNEGGNVVSAEAIEGYEGYTVYREDFNRRNWYLHGQSKDIADVTENFKRYSVKMSNSGSMDTGGKLALDFDKLPDSSYVNGIGCVFYLDVTELAQSFDLMMDVHFGAEGMKGGTGRGSDRFKIEFRGHYGLRTVANFTSFDTNMKAERLYIPQGTTTIYFEVRWDGKHMEGGKRKKFYFDKIEIKELRPIPLNTKKNGVGGYWKNVEITTFLENREINTVELEVGRFVYMDTLELPNVISVEIDDHFDQECREARIELSNPNGYFSPDYNPYYFPEIYPERSPWSYFVNNFHVGVLSDNTPVRIFMGYGLDEMRVFTGLIDKVDMIGENSIMTISCRDMYKKIQDRVILRDLEYPETYKETVPTTETIEANPSSANARTNQIIAAAKKAVAKYPGTNMDYLFLLAICQHETQMGTAGAGRPESGNYILGYGVHSSGAKQEKYAGVQKQMDMGALRYYEAMKSRNWKIKSLDDVNYFHSGGDKGDFQWSQDSPNWQNRVWQYYQQMKANPSKWGVQNVNSLAEIEEAKIPQEDVMWTKSAVIQDLLQEAGMYGWRANEHDRYYPDSVVEETYLIEVEAKTGKIWKAVEGEEGVFEAVDIHTVQTPWGWLNPFVQEYGTKFPNTGSKVGEAINEVIKDLPFRSYCDRFGTYRLERIDYQKPVVAQFDENENLISINKSIDWSRGRSHIVVWDGSNNRADFVDKEILMEIKGELRTAVVNVPWAKTYAAKREVAERLFFDMKMRCRTLQVSIPGNPALELLDRVIVRDKNTTTASVYTIKSIKSSFHVEDGYLQVIDLMWAADEVMM